MEARACERTRTTGMPSPGYYAVSATLLPGHFFAPEYRDYFRFFRDRRPFAKAGYSIFLYYVGASDTSATQGSGRINAGGGSPGTDVLLPAAHRASAISAALGRNIGADALGRAEPAKLTYDARASRQAPSSTRFIGNASGRWPW